MNSLKTFTSLFFFSFIISCSPIYGVSYDYNRSVNFINLTTYAWLPIPEKTDLNSLDIQRIKQSVNAALQAKGLTIASDNPNFLIAEHLVKKDKVNVTDWGYSYGPYGHYFGPRGVTVYQYEEGSLILDFVDSKTNDLIWRGTAKAEVDKATTPEKRDKLIKEAVQKILEHFPPPPAN
jgi:hypothetical protein